MVSTRRSAAEKSGIALRAAAASQGRSRSRQAGSTRRAGVPAVFEEMLVEAGVVPSQPADGPPRKRLKRPGEKGKAEGVADVARKAVAETSAAGRKAGDGGENDDGDDDSDEDDEDIEFEDIAIPAPVIQTTERDSDDSDSSDDGDDDDDDDDDEGVDEGGDESTKSLVDIDITASQRGDASPAPPPPPPTLELNLTAHESALVQLQAKRLGRSATAARRKPLTRAERKCRLDIHKMHVMCLLAHYARRNRWCSLEPVQTALRPLLTDKMVTYLNPAGHLSQFGRTESLKNGLQQAAAVFRARFVVTERGMKRALWAEDAAQLQDYQLPTDIESVLDADDFVQAAKMLRGSRDVGAQLFCALLRAAGVETRLVCSLQPLSFLPGAPTMPPQQKPKARPSARPPVPKIYQSPPSASSSQQQQQQQQQRQQNGVALSPLRRLGHPQAAAYNVPSIQPRTPPRRSKSSPSTSSPATAAATHVVRGESAFPICWVEVLDVAHQKWQPVDPLVTSTQWRPARLEPPASDRNNQLTYVIGFAADRSAKDVTRRYAKAFNAKTRRARVDGPAGAALAVSSSSSSSFSSPSSSLPTLTGPRWLRRVLRHYRRPYETDADEIEDTELSAIEAREPMPRNVADFQHHPIYALARHLRRHEVLLPGATAVGTVSAGSKAPSERIYRRRDVRVAYTADRWYRQGRVVLPNEIPAKWLPKRVSKRDDNDDDDIDDDGNDGNGGLYHPTPAGVPTFTPEQTEPYRAPPVVDGRVPKNKFGNVELYVPSMVPAGGVHIVDEGAARAAFLLGVDYAPALTGFRFDGGHHGTAVLRGVVVAAENADAMRAVLNGLADQTAEAEAERRTRVALRIWAALLRGLRIRERIRAAAEDRGEEVEEEEEEEIEEEKVEPQDMDPESDATEEYDMVMDDDDDQGGGGFLLE